MAIYSITTAMMNTTTTSIGATNNITYNHQGTHLGSWWQYNPVGQSSGRVWFRLPYTMNRLEAEVHLGNKIPDAISWVCDGRWYPQEYLLNMPYPMDRFQFITSIRDPNLDNYPSLPPIQVVGKPVLSDDRELDAEDAVTKKMKFFLSESGKMDFSPDTRAQVESTLSKIKNAERPTL